MSRVAVSACANRLANDWTVDSFVTRCIFVMLFVPLQALRRCSFQSLCAGRCPGHHVLARACVRTCRTGTFSLRTHNQASILSRSLLHRPLFSPVCRPGPPPTLFQWSLRSRLGFPMSSFHFREGGY
jgi:hypothetical protein